MLSPPKAAADILLVCLPLRAHVCVRVYVLSSRYIRDREVICHPFITFNPSPFVPLSPPVVEWGRCCFSGGGGLILTGQIVHC